MLLVIVFALNALDFFNIVPLDGMFDRYYDKAPGVFDKLFPSHDLKALNKPTSSMTVVDPAQDQQQAVVTFAPTIEPVITEAPTEAPTEVPTVG